MILNNNIIYMAKLEQNWKTFTISDESLASYAELVKMILNTESMDDDERQYWFDIMPSMTEAQVDRLYTILETEKNKLEKLEVKYQTEIKQLNEKHLIEWQEFQMKDSKKKISKAEKDDKDNADDVLSMLDDL